MKICFDWLLLLSVLNLFNSPLTEMILQIATNWWAVVALILQEDMNLGENLREPIRKRDMDTKMEMLCNFKRRQFAAKVMHALHIKSLRVKGMQRIH